VAKNTPKNLSTAVKKLVEIKGSLYLCIPKVIVRQLGVQTGDEAGIVAGNRMLTVIFPEKSRF